MRIQIERFGADHVDAAAAMLAARHQRDRRRYPALPEALEAPERMRRFVRAAFDRSFGGVVGLVDGQVGGYLLAESLRLEPDELDAMFYHPRTALVPASGHATAADLTREARIELYRRMYAAAAGVWLAAGAVGHYVKTPAGDADVLDAWFSLGFGRQEVLGLRDTQPLPGVTSAGVDIRAAGPVELDAAHQLVMALSRYHAGAPMFYPYLSSTQPAQRLELAASLGNPADFYVLAWEGDRPVGLLGLHGPIGSGIELMPPGCPHIVYAWVEPDVRDRGIGSLLLDRGLAWARTRGHARCTAGWGETNLSATAFWLRHGFGIVGLQLFRLIDERVLTSAEC